jgi:hypothetical protein
MNASAVFFFEEFIIICPHVLIDLLNSKSSLDFISIGLNIILLQLSQSCLVLQNKASFQSLVMA